MSPCKIVKVDFWLTILVLLIYSIRLFVAAPLETVHRCSHKPTNHDQTTQLWLDPQNFTIVEHGADNWTRDTIPNYDLTSPSGFMKSKRDIFSRLGLTIFESDLKKIAIKDDLIPFKIGVYYDESVHLLDKTRNELITQSVMPRVITFFERALSIRRSYAIRKFQMNPRCKNTTMHLGSSHGIFCGGGCENYGLCGEITVPHQHLRACKFCNQTTRICSKIPGSEGSGVLDIQLMLYVSAKQTSRCKRDQTIAYAAHCAQDAHSDRPIAGHVNLCPRSIGVEARHLHSLISTVKHELTHVLGFSASLFGYYRDQHGIPLTKRDSWPPEIDQETGYIKWSDKVVKKFVRRNWVTADGPVTREFHIMVTPTVVKEVRRHFNCSSLEGAELENQGDDGTALTHWEKRLFENEAMTGTHTQSSVYSRLTLAALQDTGWYVANLSHADKLNWGKDLGCEFAKQSCRSWIADRQARGESIRPFCEGTEHEKLRLSCSEDRNSKAVCNMKYFNEPLPAAYRNFDSIPGVARDNVSHYGGSVDLADYCPYIQEFTWGSANASVQASRCDHDNQSEFDRSAALEHYGPDAKCFEHERRWEQNSCLHRRKWHHYGAGCYNYTCTGGVLRVSVRNHSFPCLYAGQVVRVELVLDDWFYDGTIVCPSCHELCPSSYCHSFDRELVDNVMHRSSYSNDQLNDTLTRIFGRIAHLSLKNLLHFNQQAASESQTENGSHPNEIQDHKHKITDKQTEMLLQLFIDELQRPSQLLACSSASGVNSRSLFVRMVSLLSALVPLTISNIYSMCR